MIWSAAIDLKNYLLIIKTNSNNIVLKMANRKITKAASVSKALPYLPQYLKI